MNVFIVEDSASVRGRMQSMLSDIHGATVIGHAANEVDAIERIDTLLPDIVIFDICLKNEAMMGLLETIKTNHPKIKLMILTDCTSEPYSNRCKQAGNDCFLDKGLQFMQVRAALWNQVYTNRLDNKPETLQAR